MKLVEPRHQNWGRVIHNSKVDNFIYKYTNKNYWNRNENIIHKGLRHDKGGINKQYWEVCSRRGTIIYSTLHQYISQIIKELNIIVP